MGGRSSGVSGPFSALYRGEREAQPAPCRIQQTPWAGVSGGPARLCAPSEAGHGHPHPPTLLRPPPRGPGFAFGPTGPGRGLLRLPSPAPRPRYAGMVPFLWVCFEQAPKGRAVRPWGPCEPLWTARRIREENRAAGEAPTARSCGRAGSGGLGPWTCCRRGCGVWWLVGFESSVRFSTALVESSLL